MAKTMVVPCFILALIGSALLAADLGGPVAGYVAGSPGPELRAISGVPGSYLFSDPLALPEGATRVHLAPGQDFALVERGDSGMAILRLAGGAVDGVETVSGAMPGAEWAAFSPTGGSAVLFSYSARHLQLLTGLPGAPRVAADLDSSSFPEQPLMAAVSDDGSLLVTASGNSVYLVPRDGAARLLASVGSILSLVVLPNGTDVAVADRSTASIHVIGNAASSAAVKVLVSGLSGMGRIYPAADGASIFVARPGAKAVSSVDIASGEVRTFPADTAPVQLVPLRNRDTFLISARPRQPGSVFFRDGNEGRIVFIPAVKGEAAQ